MNKMKMKLTNGKWYDMEGKGGKAIRMLLE